MKIGELRHRITIQEATPAQSDSGEVTNTWEDIERRWAAIEPISGREYVQAKAAQVESSTRIRMRYFAALTTGHRIKFGARIFEINDVIHPDERKIETHAMCRESR